MDKGNFIIIFLIILVQPLLGQSNLTLPFGSPFITNYADENYLQAGKNWDIAQAENGLLYFANDYGLIEFDGYNWQRIGQPNNQSELRSFAIDGHRIYIGGTAEIGFFEKNEMGRFIYTELNHLLTDNSFSFNDVRNIAIFKEYVFFLTDNGILIYKDDHITILGQGISFRAFTFGIDELVFGANETGLFRFIDNELIPISNKNDFVGLQIEFLLTTQPDTYLVGTNTKGVFQYKGGKLNIWNDKNQALFIKNHLRHATILNKDFLLFGSLHEGLILTDYQGRVLKIINENNGLLDHNIRAIFKDKQGNIWTSVDGSVAYIELNSPFTILNKKNGLRGEVYCMLQHQNYLYVGTSRGLYVAAWPTTTFNPISFELIPKTTGQCWQLIEHQGEVLLAHHNGIYIVKKKQAQFIGGEGNWNFSVIPGTDNQLLSGNYAGVSLIERVGETYQVKHQIQGFSETARELVFDKQGNIWISHGYVGLYKMRLSKNKKAFENIELFDENKGLPSNLYNNLIQVNQGILFGTQNGVYQFNEDKNILAPNNLFSEILGNETLIRKLYQLPNGNYFSIKNYDRTDEIALIEVLEDGSFSYRETPFQKLKGQLIPAFESCIFPNDHQILIGGKQGLIVYNTNFEERLNNNHHCIITDVRLPENDSILFIGPNDASKNISKNIQHSSFQFNYSSSFFESLPYIQYATYLEGFDENWQAWSTQNYRLFTNLPKGNYTFWVKSKNIYDTEGQSDSLSFQVNQPTQSLGLYGWLLMLLTLVLLYLVYHFVNRRTYSLKTIVQNLEEDLEQKNAKVVQYKSKKNNWKKEKEQLNQKLSDALLQNEVHAGLIQNLESLNSKKTTTVDYQKAISAFQENLKEVQLQMDAHKTLETDDFLTKIKTKYPDLSARELRLCSYLKLNVSSKEIANYLGISIRGVESLRYRVRKKMGLQTGQDLTAFILKL